MKKSLLLIAVFVLCGSIGTLSGCSKQSETSPGNTAEAKENESKFQELVKKSGGKWDNLSPEEQKWVTENEAAGDEVSAKTLLEATAKGGSRPNVPKGR